MFLSIIIPHYNLPRELLERCLHSITAQGIPCDDYEVIIVDDASDEPPLWINDSYPNANVRLVIAEHGGPGAARNRGIDEAKGNYIEFVDSDDMMMPGNRINECLDFLRKESPEILRFRYRTCLPEDIEQTAEQPGLTFSNTISGAAYMKENNLSGSPCTYFFKRELAIRKGIRFPENLLHEDEEFNTILHYHAKTLVDCNAILYSYCIREGSTTANSSIEFEKKRIDDMLSVIGRLADFKRQNCHCDNITQTKGFEHKFTMLAVDAILNMMYSGMSAKEIRNKCIERLAPIGLYPLPKANYSIKYRIFRKLANSRAGMIALRIALPRKKPAKK